MDENVLMKKKVLLTGTGGRIGKYMTPAFREWFDLRTLDRIASEVDPNPIISDLQDIDVLKQAMEGCEAIVHMAATSDEAPFIEQLVPNNVIGVYNVFEAAREAGVKRIVFASTVQTVGASPPHTTIEITDPVRPNSLYGATKVLGETMGRFYHDRHGLEFVGIRIGWYHPYHSDALRNNDNARQLWLSPNDCNSLFRRAVEKPDVGFALCFGTSKTSFERLSLAPAKQYLDWEPADDITAIPTNSPPQ
jgi:nucleoside-diphosphate-sugar epimerase